MKFYRFIGHNAKRIYDPFRDHRINLKRKEGETIAPVENFNEVYRIPDNIL